MTEFEKAVLDGLAKITFPPTANCEILEFVSKPCRFKLENGKLKNVEDFVLEPVEKKVACCSLGNENFICEGNRRPVPPGPHGNYSLFNFCPWCGAKLP